MSRRLPFWVGGWLFLVVGMLLIRPVLPIDETRYLAVAWEMWWRHSIWVPFLNGEFYHGKPPLFFWLMELGWLVFGVSAWWARLIAPLFGLGALFLTAALAKRLWHGLPVPELAPTVLLGTLYWALFCSATMFDMLIGAFALLSLYGLVRVWQGGGPCNFWLTGIALGLGILAKGPVVFLPALFVATLAPWWMGDSRPPGLTWRRWYGGCLTAVAIAAAVALIWLIPMALQGGYDYFVEMTWGQTAGYTVNSFAHRRPWWWYLPVLPLIAFPWTFWPEAWQVARGLRVLRDDPGVRLCVAWSLPVFLTFSLISGKQAHYLLLMFPALALLLARAFAQFAPPMARVPLPALVYAVLGGVWLFLPLGSRLPGAPPWLGDVPFWFAASMAAALFGLALALWGSMRRSPPAARIKLLAASTWMALLLLIGGYFQASWPASDLRPASAFIASLAHKGAPLVLVAPNHGQYNFFGRLKVPIEQAHDEALKRWVYDHPEGYVIAYYDRATWPLDPEHRPVYQGLFRGGGMAIWSAAQLAAYPALMSAFK